MTSVELDGHYRPGLARISPWLMGRTYPRADVVVGVSEGAGF